ncbi:hypothetical protein HPB50_029371 [Hyalomma asiaticum]|nr:hypothetical protein HPB50_029371 [Hyalomma asiaticum]
MYQTTSSPQPGEGGDGGGCPSPAQVLRHGVSPYGFKPLCTIAEANARVLKEITSPGKGPAAKSWSYVSSMDDRIPEPEIRNECTGETSDLRSLAQT